MSLLKTVIPVLSSFAAQPWLLDEDKISITRAISPEGEAYDALAQALKKDPLAQEEGLKALCFELRKKYEGIAQKSSEATKNELLASLKAIFQPIADHEAILSGLTEYEFTFKDGSKQKRLVEKKHFNEVVALLTPKYAETYSDEAAQQNCIHAKKCVCVLTRHF